MLPMCSSKIYFSVLRAKGIQTLNFVVALFNDHSSIHVVKGVADFFQGIFILFKYVIIFEGQS